MFSVDEVSNKLGVESICEVLVLRFRHAFSQVLHSAAAIGIFEIENSCGFSKETCSLSLSEEISIVLIADFIPVVVNGPSNLIGRHVKRIERGSEQTVGVQTQVANFLERALINLHLNIAGTDIRAAGFVEGVKELISTIINIGTK